MVSAAAALVFAREVPITLLQTTDLHGRIVNPIPERPNDLPEAGLLRIASLIAAVRAETPNVLLVDCGDTVQGTPDSRETGGRLITRAMEYLRYDAWTFGNHEFDWGLNALRALHDATSLPMVVANIEARPGAEHPLPKIQPYVIRVVDGVRVALVGLTTPGIPNWLLPEYLGPLVFQRSVPALEAVLPRVRAERPDVLVLLVHQGVRPTDDAASEVNAIAAAFREFDVILGGHTHERVEGREVAGTFYLQSGYHGHVLGRVDLVYDTVARKVVRRAGRLLPVTAETPVDAGLQALIGGEVERRIAALDRAVGRAAAPLPGASRPAGISATAALLRAAIAEASGAEIVLHGALTDATLEAGPIRERDIWRIVPYENRIGIALLTFGELREILDENAGLLGSRSFMGVRGLNAVLREGAPAGERVGKMSLPDGRSPHARKRFKVAFNSYTLASGGSRFARLREIVRRPESRFELLAVDTRDAVRAYVRQRSPLVPAENPAEGLVIEPAAPARP